MAIQALTTMEIEAVSGGALLNITSTVNTLLGGISTVVTGVLDASKALLDLGYNFLAGLPLAGSLLASLALSISNTIGGVIRL